MSAGTIETPDHIRTARSARRVRRRGRLALLPLVVLFAGCAASDLYSSYQRAHPDWDPAGFPHNGADLAETLAAIHAPPRDATRTTLQQVRVLDVTTARWTPVPLEALAPGGEVRSDPTRSRLVLARVGCGVTTRQAWLANDGLSWFLVVGERLMAHHSVEFDRTCNGSATNSRSHRLPAALRKCIRQVAPTVAPGTILPDTDSPCGAVSPRL